MHVLVSLIVFSIASPQIVSDESSTVSGIAATVDGYDISAKRVNRHLKKTLGNRHLNDELLMAAQEQALDHLIDRHVVLRHILQNGAKVGDAEISMELSKLRDRLNEIAKPFDQYLSEIQSTQAELEYEFRWKLAWKKYLKKHLTNERLNQYFNKHQRKFDGTEMKVAHLLLGPANSTIEKAERLKAEIENGTTSWKQAVKEHSIATTSADSGGEIGWLTMTGPMPVHFCQTAMGLEIGEISKPVQTRFGTHLIKCLQIKPGKIGPKDAETELRQDATKFLFHKIANKHRSEAKIKMISIRKR